jgi:hypothetical protein
MPHTWYRSPCAVIISHAIYIFVTIPHYRFHLYFFFTRCCFTSESDNTHVANEDRKCKKKISPAMFIPIIAIQGVKTKVLQDAVPTNHNGNNLLCYICQLGMVSISKIISSPCTCAFLGDYTER